MGKIGIWELLVILVIVLIIFGPKALPKLGKSVGKTIGSFKKGLSEDDDDEDDEQEVKAAEMEKKPYDPEN